VAAWCGRPQLLDGGVAGALVRGAVIVPRHDHTVVIAVIVVGVVVRTVVSAAFIVIGVVVRAVIVAAFVVVATFLAIAAVMAALAAIMVGVVVVAVAAAFAAAIVIAAVTIAAAFAALAAVGEGLGHGELAVEVHWQGREAEARAASGRLQPAHWCDRTAIRS
jgi:hypothetical protein